MAKSRKHPARLSETLLADSNDRLEAANLANLAHRLAIIDAGQVVAEDSPEVREFAGVLAFLKLWNPKSDFSLLADCLVQTFAQVKSKGDRLLDFAKSMAEVYVQPAVPA